MFNWFGQQKGTPAPPGAVTRDIRDDDWHVQLDLSPQVISLEMDSERASSNETLLPTCPQSFVSASMLAVKAKLFDDGLYAGVELATQGIKEALLRSLAPVSPVVAAAARLGGIDAPASIEAQQITNAFLEDELQSKPLGFYTWSEALRQIFQQDRLLQRKLTPDDAARLAAALQANPQAMSMYGSHLDFVARLTNPFSDAMKDLRQNGGDRFFPASRSHEADIAAGLYRDRSVPEGFSLADEMLARIRNGSLSLAPTSRSGWYDWQTWCLEPLAVPDRMPEASRLQMNAGYLEQLEELFKASLSLARETHVKQLEIRELATASRGWGPREVVVHVSPELTVEPLPACYERRAQSYEFVRGVLEGSGLLGKTVRQSPDGPAERMLGVELDEMIALFKGAAAVSRQELGIEAATGIEVSRFREWASSPGLDDDIRMMVPIFYDVERGTTKVWAILGWSTEHLTIGFARNPAVCHVKGNVRLKFSSTWEDIVYPVFAEVYVSRLLDRDEFRAHCNRYKTRERILANLL